MKFTALMCALNIGLVFYAGGRFAQGHILEAALFASIGSAVMGFIYAATER